MALLNQRAKAYVARGNKTAEFFEVGSFRALAPIPAGPSGKAQYTGCRAVGDEARFIYMVRANNTAEFLRYDADGDAWSVLPDVPAGTYARVKGGNDLVFVARNDTGYVYLLRGKGPDFLRYNCVSGTWQPMRPAPFDPRGREGTWLCYDLERYVYAYPAKCSLMYRYDVTGDTWLAGSLPGVPFSGSQSGKSKKTGAGGGACWHDGIIFALKGGNTQELWQYSAAQARWSERETIPRLGSSGKAKRIKHGGDIVSYEYGNIPPVLFVLKGNKLNEVWVYEEISKGADDVSIALSADLDSEPGDITGSASPTLTATPVRPIGTACFDALGRKVNATGSLRPGVYYVGPARRRIVVIR